MTRLKQSLPITIYGDGQIVRDYVYVDDVASGVLDLVQSQQDSLLVNLGTGQGHSLLDLLRWLFREEPFSCLLLRQIGLRPHRFTPLGRGS